MCGKTFPRKSAILSHVQMHLDIRPFACTWPGCKMKFVRNHDLGRHVRSRHTRQKPFVCEWCVVSPFPFVPTPCLRESNCLFRSGQGFSRGDALSRHQQRNICVGGMSNRL
ncbi:hypothetical protein CALCODRAFT_467533 [Calocera cornea HHB12733]|uniref:C2H2-type domain-containing protein n=2 Tax=Dacrymycetaceae TaxID=5254 RepID=A0A165H7Q8_9BASI|nr:hypothetical protein CALCODRAFT_467533 [Calocera cornea HHB12733]